MTHELASFTEAVRAVVINFAHHLDNRDWDRFRALYADEVETDYTSLLGGTVQTNPGDVVIAMVKSMLTPLITQHLLGPVNVESDGTTAEARCHVRAYHVARNDPDGPAVTLAGHYIFRLHKTQQADGNDLWKINHQTLTLYYTTGDTRILQLPESPTD